MRKFTREISALIATISVGAAVTGVASASSENTVQNAPTEQQIEIVTTAGVPMPPDDTTNLPLAGVTIPPTEATEPTTFPPTAGLPLPPDEATVSPTTGELPPLAGDVAPPDGDINGDGSFNVADIVSLQKYIMNPDNENIGWWETADLCKDGQIDVFDLVAMKQRLLGTVAEKRLITQTDIVELSKKGEAITWEDLKYFECESIGSYSHMMSYEIEYSSSSYEFTFVVEGDYNGGIYFTRLESVFSGKGIDIRYEDTAAFIAEHTPPV